ncbi:MAG: Sensor histidine kinase RcsC [Chlamydiia bacterium]|nr:Sensor histidine kinase RcsC [Chlamydiia bacterium]MCH9615406.1 Sensor histidine kinase RcsC [Chlamydiia bacterium]MCH9628272.1 Sensor histidine kinase RcsC [Chlamydiia bacterium]
MDKDSYLARLETVVDTTIDGVITASVKGIIETFNHGAEKMFDYKAEEVIGQNLKILMPEPYAHEHDGYMDHYVKTGEKHIIGIGREALGRKKNGTVFPIDLAVNECEVNGVRIFTGIIRDLSDKKADEKQVRDLQKLETVGTMVNGIAHDFKNVLAPILGFADLALDLAPNDGDLHDYLERIKHGAEHAKKMIEGILNFSRPMPESEKKFVAINSILDRSEHLLKSALPEHIQIHTSFEPNLPEIHANSTQIEQVIINLCTNAIYAMQEMGGVLDISVKFKEPFLEIVVKDTGTGIPEDKIQHIFEPYFSTKPAGEGTGLGLSTIQKIVLEHGGTINCTSEQGKGTVFTLHFPLITYCSRIIQGDEKILLVFEDSSLAQAVEELLKKFGYIVSIVTNEDEAVTRLKASKYDLVVVDDFIKNIGGKIHAFSPAKIVLLTENPEKIPQSVNAVVKKPLQEEEFKSTLIKVLSLA